MPKPHKLEEIGTKEFEKTFRGHREKLHEYGADVWCITVPSVLKKKIEKYLPENMRVDGIPIVFSDDANKDKVCFLEFHTGCRGYLFNEGMRILLEGNPELKEIFYEFSDVRFGRPHSSAREGELNEVS